MAKFYLLIGIVALGIGALLFGILNFWQTPAGTVADSVHEPQQEGSLLVPKELRNAQIEDKAGAQIPLDIAMTNQDGEPVTLGQYFSKKDPRPVILTLGYYGCPMLCSLVLNGLVEGLKKVNYKLGKEYLIVSVSIDEREKSDLAKKKQASYLAALDVSQEEKEVWTFHVTTSAEAQRLASAVGFNYYYDKKIDQFAHGAGFFVLSPQGVLSRTLFGISYEPKDIKLALSEAVDGKIGSFVDRVLLSCFHYDPDSHRYGVYIFGVMRLCGVVTILILGVVLILFFRGEKRRVISSI
ncbi:MAG: SCO family protein [Myxococcales bacterium]|nr:SCO family protein [Myxococcales bacterium]USN50236.1 MAG: SCO family protein [Myxococcales bacterium]